MYGCWSSALQVHTHSLCLTVCDTTAACTHSARSSSHVEGGRDGWDRWVKGRQHLYFLMSQLCIMQKYWFSLHYFEFYLQAAGLSCNHVKNSHWTLYKTWLKLISVTPRNLLLFLLKKPTISLFGFGKLRLESISLIPKTWVWHLCANQLKVSRRK